MIPTQKLHYATVLADQRNFRRAAEVLNLTQPALSRSIQSLETTLGARLFDRAQGGVEVTAIGQLVVTRAREIVAVAINLESEVKQMQGLDSGSLKVSLSPYPSAISGKLAVARFFAAHPEIRCRIHVATYPTVADDVAQGYCDVGIADVDFAAERGLSTEVVADRPGYLIARPHHPLATRGRCALADVLQYPWAAVRFPGRVRRNLPNDVGRAGNWDRATGEFVPALETDMVSDILKTAQDSDILVGASLTMAEAELAAGKLAVLNFQEPWFSFLYGFIWRPKSTLSPATLEFMEIVREIEAEIGEMEKALRERFL